MRNNEAEIAVANGLYVRRIARWIITGLLSGVALTLFTLWVATR